jgi:hypothetical protein
MKKLNKLAPPSTDVEFNIIVDTEDTEIYIRIHNFDNVPQCAEYAHYLSKNLPLLLLKTDVMH